MLNFLQTLPVQEEGQSVVYRGPKNIVLNTNISTLELLTLTCYTDSLLMSPEHCTGLKNTCQSLRHLMVSEAMPD